MRQYFPESAPHNTFLADWGWLCGSTRLPRVHMALHLIPSLAEWRFSGRAGRQGGSSSFFSTTTTFPNPFPRSPSSGTLVFPTAFYVCFNITTILLLGLFFLMKQLFWEFLHIWTWIFLYPYTPHPFFVTSFLIKQFLGQPPHVLTIFLYHKGWKEREGNERIRIKFGWDKRGIINHHHHHCHCWGFI